MGLSTMIFLGGYTSLKTLTTCFVVLWERVFQLYIFFLWVDNLAEIFPILKGYDFVWMKVLKFGLLIILNHSSKYFSSSLEIKRIAFNVVNETNEIE
jgi:hypothetical protein